MFYRRLVAESGIIPKVLAICKVAKDLFVHLKFLMSCRKRLTILSQQVVQ